MAPFAKIWKNTEQEKLPTETFKQRPSRHFLKYY